jgi:hypothetical protein
MEMSEPSDTSPAAERLQLELYRAMSPGEKLALVLDLTDTARSFSRAGIRMRHPEAGEHEVTLRLAVLEYGPELVRTAFGEQAWLEPRKCSGGNAPREVLREK